MKLTLRDCRKRLLALAFVMGILGDALLTKGPAGPGMITWSILGVLGIYAASRASGTSLPPASWGWMTAAVGFAGLTAFRGAETLLGLSLMAGVASLVLAAWSASGGKPSKGSLTDYVIRPMATTVQSLAGGLLWLRPDPVPPPAAHTRVGLSLQPWYRIGFGTVVAIPLLVAFGSLFANADPVFQKGWARLLSWDLPTLLSHLMPTFAWGWIVAGFGHQLLAPNLFPEFTLAAPASPLRSWRLEVLTVLGLLTVLFLAFVLIQIRYLFGSDELVQSTLALTYAEYARRGFFELLAVAALLIPVLLWADWLLGNEPRPGTFQTMTLLLVVLLGIIMVSAWKRLHLYTAAYGWTQQRFYAAAALVWIALVTGWFVVSVVPRRRHHFAVGALTAALAVLVALHGVNPDAFIARRNLARAAAGQPFDVSHAARLGPDAVPILLANLASLPDPVRTELREALSKRWTKETAGGWRTWNLSRSRAHHLMAPVP